MMNRLRTAYYILRRLGPRIVWLRARVYLSKSTGHARRVFRPRPWELINLAPITRPGTPTDPDEYAQYKRDHPPSFLFPLGQPPAVPLTLRAAGVERQPPFAERLALLARERCVYFFRTPSPTPIDWHANPIDQTRSDPSETWCEVPDYLPEQGDPRMLWEPSRAAWAIDLARARPYGLELDSGPLFWRWVDSWMAACPPFKGFQWKCGQESSVRLIAIALGFWSLATDRATTSERWVQFARLAWATGYRVRRHINYAISQNNNHAMSEAFGLLLASQLFPEFREADEWRATGRRVLAQAIRRQAYADGSYVQHSMNYQRVMLQGSMLGLRLAELAGQPFDPDIYDRLGRCGEFLYQMMDPDTGRLPHYGNNDGAWVLPLDECDFTDFRPVIQATHYLTHRRRLLPPGAWDEDLLWLFGPQALDSEPATARRPTSSAFEVGGYYTLRRRESWAMVRCHTYRDRPGHCDQLQLDLWWHGQNVLQDCGTYHYYVPERPDLERYFKSTAAHNVIAIDNSEPAEFVSRFLRFPWPRGRKRHYEVTNDGPAWFEGESYDYDRAPWHVLHRRAVIGLVSNVWIIVDDLLGEGKHHATLRWHMLDAPYNVDSKECVVRLETPAGNVFATITGRPAAPRRLEVLRGRNEPNRVQGLAAPYYGELLAIPTLEASWRCQLPQRIITVVGLGGWPRLQWIDQVSEHQHWKLVVDGVASTLALGAPERSADAVFLSCAAADM